MSVIHCRNCGQELSEGARFCSNCGTKVEETPSSPRQERPQPQTKLDVEAERISSERASRLYEADQERKKNRQTYNIDDFSWDLNGYPSQGSHRTEEVDFHWDNQRPERKPEQEEDVIDFSRPVEQEEVIDFRPEPEDKPAEAEAAFTEGPESDHLGEELAAEEDGFDADHARHSEEKIDKFFTYSTKNAAFQDLLDKEYSKLADDDNVRERQETRRIAEAHQSSIQQDLDKLMGLVDSAKKADESAPADPAGSAERLPAEGISAEEAKVPEAEGTQTAPAKARPAETEEPAAEPEAEVTAGQEAAETQAAPAEDRPAETEEPDAEPEAEVTAGQEAAETQAAPEARPAETEELPAAVSAGSPAKREETPVKPAQAPEREQAETPVSRGGVTSKPHEPEARRKDFNDIFSDDNKPEPPKRKHPVLTVIGIIVLLIILFEVVVICVKQFAPNSAFGLQIQAFYDKIFDLISGITG